MKKETIRIQLITMRILHPDPVVKIVAKCADKVLDYLDDNNDNHDGSDGPSSSGQMLLIDKN